MNPEFRRNLWLELTPRRMTAMAGALALIFFAASLSGTLGNVAELFFYLIVVLWGSRNAALSVVGEIRARTWDGQRLSSLGPGQMMWGKLFGSTLYTWFGGAICLAVILAETVSAKGALVAATDLAYFLIIGIIAQAGALLASLVAVIREKAHTRLDVFFYQLVGLFAAILANWLWSISDPSVSLFGTRDATLNVAFNWWGMQADMRLFLLVSLAAFAGWLVVGCHRLMRIELMMRNGPWVWLAFLIFVGAYAAGFDGASIGRETLRIVGGQPRWWQAGIAFAVLGYVMVFLEPKDSVRFRWIAGRFAMGRVGAALAALPGWTMTWFAVAVCAVALIIQSGMSGDTFGQMRVASLVGFFTRDLALVLLAGMLARRHGDLAGLTILAALYLLLPMIFEGMQLGGAQVLFGPRASSPAWLSPVIAWGEAALAIAFVATSAKLAEHKAAG